ncbi:hypothetical protein QOT17_003254 [Balamuthia mandrillaris]
MSSTSRVVCVALLFLAVAANSPSLVEKLSDYVIVDPFVNLGELNNRASDPTQNFELSFRAFGQQFDMQLSEDNDLLGPNYKEVRVGPLSERVEVRGSQSRMFKGKVAGDDKSWVLVHQRKDNQVSNRSLYGVVSAFGDEFGFEPAVTHLNVENKESLIVHRTADLHENTKDEGSMHGELQFLERKIIEKVQPRLEYPCCSQDDSYAWTTECEVEHPFCIGTLFLSSQHLEDFLFDSCHPRLSVVDSNVNINKPGCILYSYGVELFQGRVRTFLLPQQHWGSSPVVVDVSRLSLTVSSYLYNLTGLLSPVQNDLESLFHSSIDVYAYFTERATIYRGFQYRRSMCNREINVIVSYLREFSPYESQVLLAQQIGSTLGAGRDSVDNGCSADKFIMSPLFSQTPRTQWSTCSVAEVQRWLETEYGIQGSACLDNAPTRIQEVVLHPSSVNVFSGSRQGTVQRLTEEDGKCLVLLEGQEEGGQDSNPPVHLSNINWVLPEDIHLDEVTSMKLTISYINTGVDRWFFFLRDFAGARSIALGSTFLDPSREKGQVVTRTFQLGVDYPFADLVQADSRQVRLQVRTKRNRPTVDKRFLLDEAFLTIVHGPRTIMQ